MNRRRMIGTMAGYMPLIRRAVVVAYQARSLSRSLLGTKQKGVHVKKLKRRSLIRWSVNCKVDVYVLT